MKNRNRPSTLFNRFLLIIFIILLVTLLLVQPCKNKIRDIVYHNPPSITIGRVVR